MNKNLKNKAKQIYKGYEVLQRAEQKHGTMIPRQSAREQCTSWWIATSAVGPTAEKKTKKKQEKGKTCWFFRHRDYFSTNTWKWHAF